MTKRQYLKALKELPKLREAEATVKKWEEGITALGPAAANLDITELNEDGSFKCKPKEESGEDRESTRGAA